MKIKYCTYFGDLFRQCKANHIERYDFKAREWKPYFLAPERIEDFVCSTQGWSYRERTPEEVFEMCL